jgi:hypothetical protein
MKTRLEPKWRLSDKQREQMRLLLLDVPASADTDDPAVIRLLEG